MRGFKLRKQPINSIDLESLIVKYLSDNISDEELEALEKWLEDPRNKLVFEKYVRTSYDMNSVLLDTGAATSFENLLPHVTSRPPRKRLRIWYRVAAAIVILLALGLGYLYFPYSANTSYHLTPEVEDITLELENGEIRVIKPGQFESITLENGQVVGQQESHRITYESVSDVTELEYHTLRVPFGRRFEIQLSDGSFVHLQAGTSLRYPVGFAPRGQRMVYLEGEAYFQIAENKEVPFVVVADRLHVKVTGTAFNFSAYPEDRYFDVVLEEGGVGMYTEEMTMDNATLLRPGYIGTFSREDESVSVMEVNTTIYTNWMDGKLTFRNMAFDNILRKLERHYNIKMVNQNKQLGQEIFNASFDKDETIENVLTYFNDSYKIQFVVEDNTVFIQ